MKTYPEEKEDTKKCPFFYIEEKGDHPKCENGGYCTDRYLECNKKRCNLQKGLTTGNL